MRIQRSLVGLFCVTFGTVACAACTSLIGADIPITPSLDGGGDAGADVVDADGGGVIGADTRLVDSADSADTSALCAKLGSDAAEIFVDQAGSDVGATGTRACPFATIGEGLGAAERSVAPTKVVHVAPGRYAKEAFPLRVKGGVSLVGSDVDRASAADDTVIVGSGPYTNPIDGVAAKATLVVGDKTGVSSVEQLRVDGEGDLTARYGIVCEEGPAAPLGSHAPNAILKGVDVRGYPSAAGTGARAIFVTTKSIESGCHLQLVSSRVHASFSGLDAMGCDLAGVGGPVTLEVGDGTSAGGNDFYDLGDVGVNSGWGLRVADCVTYASIRGNTFRTTPGGLEVSQEDHTTINRGYVEISDNHLVDLTNWGIALIRSSVVAKLERNDIRRVLSKWTYPAAGLLLDSAGEAAGTLPGRPRPRIAHARRNLIVGNDVGLDIRNTTMMDSDFGTSADHGLNTFACNDRGRRYSNLQGYDVMFVATREGNAVMPMVGNLWDHAPVTPTQQAIDGADLYSFDLAAPDTSDATVEPAACAKAAAP